MKGNSISILSTKVLEPPYIDKAAAHGISIASHSFIQINPVKSEALIKEIQALASKEITAVFTSVNSVPIVSDYIDGCNPRWKIYCTNGATLNEVNRCFKHCIVAGTAKNGAELADEIIKSKGVRPVVFFGSDIRIDTLIDKLSASDIQIQELTIYNTVLTPVEIHAAHDGIVFFSPSAVRSFFSTNMVDEKAVLFAIGNSTAAAIEGIPNPVVVSSAPDKTSIINTIIEYYKK